MAKAWAAGVWTCVSLWAGPAFAEDTDIVFNFTIGQLQGAQSSSTVMTPRLRGSIGVAKDLRLGLQWGFTTVSVPALSDDGRQAITSRETGFLNPQIELTYILDADVLDFSLGAAFAFPVADADSAGRQAAFQVALGAVGAWDPWLYLPSTLTLAVPLRARIDFGPVIAGLDGTFFLLVPTDSNPRRKTELRAQAGLEGVFPNGVVDLGVRLQAVQVGASGLTGAYLQTSLVPLARLFVGPARLELRFNFNFDTPHGTTFTERGTWGLSVGAGARF